MNPSPTLVPAPVLLWRAALLLDRDVVPHVAGDVFNATHDAKTRIALVALVLNDHFDTDPALGWPMLEDDPTSIDLRKVRLEEDVRPDLSGVELLHDDLPNYCALPECQNAPHRGETLCDLHLQAYLAARLGAWTTS